MIEPLISIAMTTYNGEHFLAQQLESILSQSYRSLEIIICDDGSTDSTRDILHHYAQKDPRIQLFLNETNVGLVKNFEKALSLCIGDYIALADQDDIWLTKKVEILLNNIHGHILIHSDAFLMDEKGTIFANSYAHYSTINYQKNMKSHIMENNVTGCTTLFKKSLLASALPFPPNTLVHDWWLALCAYKLGTITYLPIPLINYRQHQNNQIGAAQCKSLNTFEKTINFYEKKINFLKSLYNVRFFSYEEKKFILTMIQYYEDFFQKTVRVKSFSTHLFNFHYFYQNKSYLYKIIGLLLSLFGYKIQKRIWKVFS
jgi:glycosyltransferase involved in cell wall biosynthesis